MNWLGFSPHTYGVRIYNWHDVSTEPDSPNGLSYIG